MTILLSPLAYFAVRGRASTAGTAKCRKRSLLAGCHIRDHQVFMDQFSTKKTLWESQLPVNMKSLQSSLIHDLNLPSLFRKRD